MNRRNAKQRGHLSARGQGVVSVGNRKRVVIVDGKEYRVRPMRPDDCRSEGNNIEGSIPGSRSRTCLLAQAPGCPSGHAHCSYGDDAAALTASRPRIGHVISRGSRRRFCCDACLRVLRGDVAAQESDHASGVISPPEPIRSAPQYIDANSTVSKTALDSTDAQLAEVSHDGCQYPEHDAKSGETPSLPDGSAIADTQAPEHAVESPRLHSSATPAEDETPDSRRDQTLIEFVDTEPATDSDDAKAAPDPTVTDGSDGGRNIPLAEEGAGKVAATPAESQATMPGYLSNDACKAVRIDSEAVGYAHRVECLSDHRVKVDVVRGEALQLSFTCDIDQLDERSVDRRLAVLALPYSIAVQRKLDSVRIVEAARRATTHDSKVRPLDSAADRATELLDASDIIDHVRRDMISVGFQADPEVGVALYLAKLTALLPEPLYVYIVGPASSLKTSYADTTAELMPPEVRKHLTELTKKALYYGRALLAHFGIFLDEMPLRGSGTVLDLKVLREMYSKGWCEIEVTVGRSTITKRVQGPVLVVQTTTATRFDEQDQSRRLIIDLADTPERTTKVLAMMSRKYTGRLNAGDRELILESHREIHRLLPTGVEVIIPYAEILARLLPTDRITVLRTFRSLASLVSASALLHIRHREFDGDNRLIADLDDYRIVYEAAGEFLTASLAQSMLPPSAMAWLDRVLDGIAQKALAGAKAGVASAVADLNRLGTENLLASHRRWRKWLTIQDLMDLTGRPRSTIQRYLDQLHQAGWIERRRKQRRDEYRLATPDAQPPTCPGLPTPDDLAREHMGT